MEEEEENVTPLHIPSNSFATSYASTWTIPESGLLTDEELELLKNVNCSYLSSGRAPTLLDLKKHAHSLTNLIRKLAPSTSGAAIGQNDRNAYNLGFWENDAFDWLNRLDVPYNNDDESHHVPLWAIANIVRTDSTDTGPEHHCPLTEVKDSGHWAKKGASRRPYQTHHALTMHANECLEILDHEYSSTGGLMSMLPTEKDHDTDQLRGARNSLLGQWLLHHQHLVARMHELEIDYANALDVLAGEAIVPNQILRRAGPDGKSKGREVAYPQDRYVLVNAGDDVTSFLHRKLDQAEAQVEQKAKAWKNAGVAGERMWMKKRGGEWYARGIIPVDVLTRFYRIAGKGQDSPLFVLPAIEQHPGVGHTRTIEKRPTVVSVVTPVFPKRVSEWEQKFQEKLARAKETEVINRRLERERIELDDVMAIQNAELRQNREDLAFYEANPTEGDAGNYQAMMKQLRVLKRKMKRLSTDLPVKYRYLLELNEELDEQPNKRPGKDSGQYLDEDLGEELDIGLSEM
ncbi:hypothetical protein AK830_g463 [Neonectria ditissima]|uniref:Uncharacterized protein n=1 Tax=Neonectria ditissima TaxID=78410 RepID=A0A0N8H917_9HYPO|nr:hypothetical protein AK830_g463 [Neonectria ditissima]